MTEVVAALLGLAVGAVIGGLGGGGGVLTVPALVYVLGRTAQDATTGSVIIVGVTALVGVLARLRDHGVHWRTGLAFGMVGIPAAYLGTALNRAASQPVLLLAFAGLTIPAAGAMLLNDRGRHGGSADPTPPSAGGAAEDADQPRGGTGVAVRPRTPAGSRVLTATRTAVCGAVIGLLTGFLGVGGGFLVVPALVIVLRMPMTLAAGTSLLIIALNSVSSVLSRASDLHLDWYIVAPFTLAAVLGSLLGKRVADELSGSVLTRAFAVVLVAVGVLVGIESIVAL